MEEQNWSPAGPGCPSPASLALVCPSGLRLAAEEVALGPESTRLHMLPASICFPLKPAGLGCQASPVPAPPGLCSLSLSLHLLLRQILAQLSRPLYFSHRASSSLPFSLPFLPVCPTTFAP